ncbi:MAG: hypothetical protein V7776_03290 [Halopseudomonas aestusnigri]
MEAQIFILKTSIVVFLSSVSLIIAFGLLSGRINLTGLLKDKENGEFSPGRLQLLIFTIGGGVFYLSKILSDPHLKSLPEVPNEVLLIIGGSNLGYLLAKVYSRFISSKI